MRNLLKLRVKSKVDQIGSMAAMAGCGDQKPDLRLTISKIRQLHSYANPRWIIIGCNQAHTKSQYSVKECRGTLPECFDLLF